MVGEIATFDLEIIHKRGKENVTVGSFSLSLKDEYPLLLSISTIVPKWIDETRSEYVKNLETYIVINENIHNSKLKWKNDILWYK